MSLINDALKRAKQAQDENPPATPPLEFRAAEPEPRRKDRTILLISGLSLVLVMLLGFAGVLGWFVSQSKTNELPVAARVADAPLPQLPQQVPAEVVAPTNPTPVLTPKADEYIEHPDEPRTNGIPVVAAMVEALKPAPLKLQGIFFNPSSPSVVVNGKPIYLGDRVNGFRLVAVSPVAATFVSATETNVLSLSGQ